MNASTRWLIQVVDERLREPKFLHVIETDAGDGDRVSGDVLEWHADARRALRFASKHAAERFGFDRLTEPFRAYQIASADLVETPDVEDDQFFEAA